MTLLKIPPNATGYPQSPSRDHVKVHFDLLQDDDGYPPVKSESLWAIKLGEGRFRVDNIPFFAYGVSYCDMILARKDEGGRLKYESVLEAGGHSTVRVIFYDRPETQEHLTERVNGLKNHLRKIGCSSETSHIPGLISVDIPPQVALGTVRLILNKGKEQGLWGYEEAALAHSE